MTAVSVARQCGIVKPFQRVFLGDIDEKEVKGRARILWKDLEYSENKLNPQLEPEEENIPIPTANTPKDNRLLKSLCT